MLLGNTYIIVWPLDCSHPFLRNSGKKYEWKHSTKSSSGLAKNDTGWQHPTGPRPAIYRKYNYRGYTECLLHVRKFCILRQVPVPTAVYLPPERNALCIIQRWRSSDFFPLFISVNTIIKLNNIMNISFSSTKLHKSFKIALF